jgi:hypothetical protein
MIINDKRRHNPDGSPRYNVDRQADKNYIPPMTHPYASSWSQPDQSRMAIDDTYAIMDRRTFLELEEYSATMPSGVYEGKMWRRHNGSFDRSPDRKPPVWLLVWYGRSDRPNVVSNNWRKIILSDANIEEEK